MTYVEGDPRGEEGRTLKVNYAGGEPTLVTSCESNKDMHCYNSPTCHRSSNNCLSVNKESCETFKSSGERILSKAISFKNNFGSYCNDKGATTNHPNVNHPNCKTLTLEDLNLPSSVMNTIRRAVGTDEVSRADLEKRWNSHLVTAHHAKSPATQIKLAQVPV